MRACRFWLNLTSSVTLDYLIYHFWATGLIVAVFCISDYLTTVKTSGMFISKKFVELHKGKIWFHSDGGGKGTTFYFSLPIITKKPLDPHEGEGLVLH